MEFDRESIKLKKEYIISIIGCDDFTNIPMNLTKEQLILFEEFARKSKQISTYSCMPTIEIEELGDG